jgi:hypothetical protein
LVAFALGAVVWHRRHSLSVGRGLAKRRGWTLYPRHEAELLERLDGLALMQIGHSRRIARAFGASGRLFLFPYTCETGFEHRRQSHHWIVAACEVEHECSRATITAQDWLIAAASASCCRELPLSAPTANTEATAGRGYAAIVEDPEEWQSRCRNGLQAWFASQPPNRSWEIVPGFIVGYEPGSQQDASALADLGEAVRGLARQLGDAAVPPEQ